jgi:hypothetical protein
METGRTSPAIFGCEDASGAFAGEYVVKLRGGIDTRESGLMRELIGVELAAHFGIPTPEPAFIQIDAPLVELVATAQPDRAAFIRNSVGLNFGTKMVVGFSTWPVGRSIPESVWQTATDIFAFDALIQNPDRRSENPNLFINGDIVLIFDHETAFSFLLDLFPSRSPWRLDSQPYLTNHVFFRRLKRQNVELAGFLSALTTLSDTVIAGILSEIPNEWNTEAAGKIDVHLKSMRTHSEDFCGEVRRFLI